MVEWKVSAPVGVSKSGRVRIKEIVVTPEQARFSAYKARRLGEDTDIVLPGTYKGLYVKNSLVMSNTLMEQKTNIDFVLAAKGQVLVNGLGLGMVLEALLDKEVVDHVTVIEIDPDVIELVGPVFKGERVDIICADAFEYKPERGRMFNSVWHDIWPDISSQNLEEMAKLHRKYARRAQYQASWSRDRCQKLKRRQQRGYLR